MQFRLGLARIGRKAVIDEPVLSLDLPGAWRVAFERAYHMLNSAGVKLLLASYFGPLRENFLTALKLPVAGIKGVQPQVNTKPG